MRFLGLFMSHPLTCPPWLHRFMLPGFIATMGALTSADGRSHSRVVSGLFAPQVPDTRLAAWVFFLQIPITAMWPRACILANSRDPCLTRLIFRSFRLQPPHCHFSAIALSRYLTVADCRVYPPGRPIRSEGMPSRGQGFTTYQEAPRQVWPNRVHLRYGLIVILRLLSTLLHRNAVTAFGFRLVTFA